jgi:hypothetical protein
MSVFQVRLNNINQGQLDINPNTVNVSTGQGQQMQPSIQRTMFIQGPTGTFLRLRDGDVFTACNYWKRFTPENQGLENSAVVCLVDDGQPYSTGVAFSSSLAPYANTIASTDDPVYFGTSDFAAPGSGNSNTGATAQQLTIVATGGSATVVLNGDVNATFTLASAEMISFAQGEFSVSILEVTSGTANVFAGLSTPCAVGYSNICPYVATAAGYVDGDGDTVYNVCP